MKPKVYIETTIVSYLTSRKSRNVIVAGQQQATHDWWASAPDRFELFVSRLVVEEAGAGDAHAAAKRLAIISSIPRLAVGEATLLLNEELVRVGAFPPRATNDALHFAIAAVNGLEFLLTWNCRHLANAITRRVIEETCRQTGFEPPVICIPSELLEE